MFLKQLVLINWGNLPNRVLDFGPVNLLSGGNGSGKTTAADAIQTVMTAAHDTLFAFNPGQEEASQRSRGKQVRTLASYVLGCDDGAYARPNGATCYLAASFHPTQGEQAQAFTAVMAMDAFIEGSGNQRTARLKQQQFFIVNCEQMALADFQEQTPQGPQWLPVAKVFKRLQKDYGEVERCDNKKHYLRALYGALRGMPSHAMGEREAMNAAKAFARFMAYKPVKSVNQFVGQEILDPIDLGEAIKEVSELMKSINRIEKEAKRVRAASDMLTAAHNGIERYLTDWSGCRADELAVAIAKYRADQQAYLKAKATQQDIQQNLDSLERQIVVEQKQYQQLEDELRDIAAQRQGSQLHTKDQLETELADAKQVLTSLQQQLPQQLLALQAGIVTLQAQKPQIAASNAMLADKVGKLPALDFDINDLAGDDWVGNENLVNRLLGVAALADQYVAIVEALGDADQGVLADLRSQMQQSEQGIAKIREKIQRLQGSQQGSQRGLPGFVEEALAYIRQQLPQAKPAVLADFVEVQDASWQSAIEGYLAMARFGIVVDPDYEVEAAQLLRDLPAKNRARVIQGQQARKDANRRPVEQNSLINQLVMDNETVKAYLTASFGSAVLVNSEAELKNTRRGLTKTGIATGGYAYYRCDIADRDLVFGQSGRARSQAAVEVQITELQQDMQPLLAHYSVQQDAYNQLKSVARVQLPIEAFLDAKERQRINQSRLEGLDLTDTASLQLRYDEKLAALHAQREKLDQTISERGRALGKLESIAKQVAKLDEQQEATQIIAEDAEESLAAVAKAWPQLKLKALISEATERADQLKLDALTAELEQKSQSLLSTVVQVDKSIAQYNLQAQAHEQLLFNLQGQGIESLAFFEAAVELEAEITRLQTQLTHNVLMGREQSLHELRESFHSAFVTNLCHAVYRAVESGKARLEQLNDELQHYRFGADKERFEFGWSWVPEFKEYWQFLEEIRQNPSLGERNSLFDVALSASAQKVLDKWMDMLLSDNEQQAMAELARISDYRNYRNYEIYKIPEGKQPIALSQYGTGSGGQLETPAYIIRSAAVTSAFGFDQGDSHLRMVLVDEAFSKMDETRSREVIDYLTKTQGLQLLFIMPTSKAGPYKDVVSHQFVFSKVPGSQPVGELTSTVLLDRQRFNQDKIKVLWAQHRKVLRRQAELEFMESFA
ncbi:ATP-binding protein [Salinibius halmophilus]|uniref:ATP-binding protein n=1 Tax=Salinibius halmophilus TaxID=1853216 RepID=UPI000E66A241|nr:SbcC/MukB-like Walker B domain-containing protein [Salinibius halmophilus]